jgi:hypothetical protein
MRTHFLHEYTMMIPHNVGMSSAVVLKKIAPAPMECQAFAAFSKATIWPYEPSTELRGHLDDSRGMARQAGRFRRGKKRLGTCAERDTRD